ncbi:hypothetical protein C8D83_1193 [Halothiobacillus neapolitanus]|nr:hypothetical protein C8D83_1193 [Halothiobacillus neapolitanus]
MASQVDDATVTHEYVQPRGQSQLFDISACSGIGGGQDKNSCNGYPGTVSVQPPHLPNLGRLCLLPDGQ